MSSSETALDEVVTYGKNSSDTEKTHDMKHSYRHAGIGTVCRKLYGSYIHLRLHSEFATQPSCSLSLPPKVWQWMRESAAMTRRMAGAAEVMPEASPVPLL